MGREAAARAEARGIAQRLEDTEDVLKEVSVLELCVLELSRTSSLLEFLQSRAAV